MLGKTFFMTFVFLFLSTPGVLADTYTVTKTADTTEAGSLRWAITQANNHEGPDTIEFNIPTTDSGYTTEAGGGGNWWWSIRPASLLPALTDNGTVIDGTTQTTYKGNANTLGPEIEILDIAAILNGPGITVQSADNIIQSLTINNFIQGIDISGEGALRNEIRGNYILNNGTRGENFGVNIYLQNGAKYNIIGGTTETEGNIISSGRNFGVYIMGTDSNEVVGNYIGIDYTGTADWGNADNGVFITDYRGLAASRFNTVRGNFISGNGSNGVAITGTGSNGNSVIGNYIGTNKNGTGAIANFAGITLSSVEGTVIENNVISGNTTLGIMIMNACRNNRVIGNRIGVTAGGEGNLANGLGIIITNESQSNLIQNNTIAFNNSVGIQMVGTNSDYNTITQNSIFENNYMGIDLAPNGTTANDSVGHTGPNQNLNFPVISSAIYESGTGQTSVTGIADVNITVEVFVADPDPLGFGQGKTYKGSAISDANGNWSITITSVTTADSLTSTATDSQGNTSEFSQNAGVSATTSTTTTTTTTTIAGATTTTTTAATTTTSGSATTTTIAGATTTTAQSGAATTSTTTTTTITTTITLPITITLPSAPGQPALISLNYDLGNEETATLIIISAEDPNSRIERSLTAGAVKTFTSYLFSDSGVTGRSGTYIYKIISPKGTVISKGKFLVP